MRTRLIVLAAFVATLALGGVAAAYDQIESSVGQFGTDTLLADSKALATGSSSDDSAYATTLGTLQQLANDRDRLAAKIKKVLNDAPHNQGLHRGQVKHYLRLANNLLQRADALAGS